MVRARAKRQRQAMVEQSALVWGKIDNLKEYIETGRAKSAASEKLPAVPMVDEFLAEIQRTGRFVMPEELEKRKRGATG